MECCGLRAVSYEQRLQSGFQYIVAVFDVELYF
jgi:hypothetical protein